jgi:hypothetical protein
MKLTVTFIRYFLIVLWVYASVSKLITFDEFQVQLAQSPLLSAYAVPVSYVVIIAELSIAVLLCVRRSLLIGLYLSFGLMTAFSVYIYLILNYSDFVPCSCGGILEKMGWKEHFWFNITVCLLILLAIIFTDIFKKRMLILSSVLLVLSAGMVTVLFLQSEYNINDGGFTRNFISQKLEEDKALDLSINAYYIAGSYEEKIYLGNYNKPFNVAVVDKNMRKKHDYKVDIDRKDIPFHSIKLRVLHPYFYLGDGISAVLLRGALGKWNAKTISYRQTHFTDFIPVDSTRFVVKGYSKKSGQNILGVLHTHKDGQVLESHQELLEKQIDGVFDTDGILNYSTQQQKAVYTYFYRNQYLVTDANLNLLHRGNTIDTTSIAQIKVSKLKNGEHKMSAPPQTINKNVVAHRNLLFNISNSIGKSESKSMWKQAVIVDVYDFVKQAYIGSFYVYHRGEHKLSDMLVTDHYLYGLFDRELVRFILPEQLRERIY